MFHLSIKLKKIIAGIVLGLALSDLALQAIESYQESSNSNSYSFSLHTTEGELLSRRAGRLQFELYPPSIYRNKPSQESSAFRINSLGLRGAETSSAPAGRRRIVLGGASTAFGYGASDDSHTLAAELEHALTGSEVVNTGVMGFTSQQELGFFVSDVMQLAPNLVISLSGWNDFFQQSWLGYSHGTSFEQLVSRLVLSANVTHLNPLRRFVFGAEQLFFPSVSDRLREAWKSFHEWPTFEPCPPNLAAGFVHNIKTMASLVSQVLRGRFIVVLQPSFNAMRVKRGILPAGQDPLFLSSSRGFNCFRDAASTELRKQGIEVYDLDSAYPLLSENVFIDHVHFTDEGNRILAQELSRLILNTP